MQVAGIIAEYNPFHTGHAHQLALTRECGATHIAVVMSGSFVQRGDIAVCSKFVRARAALAAGADLVAELPVPYSLASARTFARAGVFLLNRLGAGILSFGSESGNLRELEEASALLRRAEASPELDALLAQGTSYPRARAEAAVQLGGRQWKEFLAGPNNLLGIEYRNAVRELAPDMRVFTIPRRGAAHDGGATGGFASASHLRGLLRAGNWKEAAPYLPSEMASLLRAEQERGRAPVSADPLQRLALWKLRGMDAVDFGLLPDVSAGLENRLARAAQNAVDLDDFCMSVKNKRHTLARIRRIVWCALLDITREIQEAPPPYVRILALNRRGAEILAAVKRKNGAPIGSNFADLSHSFPVETTLEARATDLAALAMPRPAPAGMDFTKGVFFQKNNR